MVGARGRRFAGLSTKCGHPGDRKTGPGKMEKGQRLSSAKFSRNRNVPVQNYSRQDTLFSNHGKSTDRNENQNKNAQYHDSPRHAHSCESQSCLTAKFNRNFLSNLFMQQSRYWILIYQFYCMMPGFY